MHYSRQALCSLFLCVISAQIFAFEEEKLTRIRPELSGRPSSEPFMSGDTFRKYCDLIFDEEYTHFDPAKVNNGDIIFISQSGNVNPLTTFFTQYHPVIKARYIIVTHNGDLPVTEKYWQYLDDDKIFLWFAQNVAFSHPKLIPIPIGLENAWWGRGYNRLIPILQEHNKGRDHKKYLTLLNFSVNTNKDREIVYNYFHDKPFCYCSGKRIYHHICKTFAIQNLFLVLTEMG